jgi:hypothetical protein
MKARRTNRSLIGRLTLTCALALAAVAGCSGELADAPADPGPSSVIPPPATPAPRGDAAPTETPPRPKPIPPQPVGPYTGLVGTTDVSILYPLPAAGQSTAFVRPSEVGNFGALLPSSVVDATLGVGGALEPARSGPSGYAELALIGVRLDPCSHRDGGPCKREVRAVFQALYDEPAGPTAADGGIHVLYDIDDAELFTMMKEILTLKHANGDLALQELAPHPILTQQGLAGPFANGLRNIVLAHLGEDRIVRVTLFDHGFRLDGDDWQFRSFTRIGTEIHERTIAGTGGHTGQMIAGSSADDPLTSSAAFVSGEDLDVLGPLLSGPRPPSPDAPVASIVQAAIDAALELQNPNIHDSESTSCASCHLAEPVRRMGEALYAPDFSKAFTHTRSLAYVNEHTSATNFHAFGYLRRNVSIMQRTANESVVVATAMEKAVQ